MRITKTYQKNACHYFMRIIFKLYSKQQADKSRVFGQF